LEISQNGYLHSLPLMLNNYTPDLTYLPAFLYHLAIDVNWEEEQPCFHDICCELASFYSIHHSYADDYSDNLELSETSSSQPSSSWTLCQHMVQHVLFPAFRSHLLPSTKHAADGTVVQIACLPDLYKVFERC
jgi:DNA mismatch repair protein MLH1